MYNHLCMYIYVFKILLMLKKPWKQDKKNINVIGTYLEYKKEKFHDDYGCYIMITMTMMMMMVAMMI